MVQAERSVAEGRVRRWRIGSREAADRRAYVGARRERAAGRESARCEREPGVQECRASCAPVFARSLAWTPGKSSGLVTTDFVLLKLFDLGDVLAQTEFPTDLRYRIELLNR